MPRVLASVLGLSVLLFLAAGCAGSSETVREEEGSTPPAKDAPSGGSEPRPEPREEPSPAPEDEPGPRAPLSPLDPSLVDGSHGFRLSPLRGMHHFAEAAGRGIDKKTQAFLEASGMRRGPDKLYLFYRSDPFLGLIVDRGRDERFSRELDEKSFSDLEVSYRRSLAPFGMRLVSFERFGACGTPAILLQYRRTRKPYLTALAAIYYGFPSGRILTATYSADSYSWSEDLRGKLRASLATFRAEDGGEER